LRPPWRVAPTNRGNHHDSTPERSRPSPRSVQEVRRVRHAAQIQVDRAVDPAPGRDPRLADERLRLLRRYAREAGQDPWRTRTAFAPRRHLARIHAVLAARARRAGMDRGADAPGAPGRARRGLRARAQPVVRAGNHRPEFLDHVHQRVEPAQRRVPHRAGFGRQAVRPGQGPAELRRPIMKILVIGGTGLIGSKLVDILVRRGHQAIAAAPSTGVNTLTGEGLDAALAGVDVVVDVANSPSFEDKAVLEFFQTSGRNLLAAEAAAGVRHHVALSVVGTHRLAASGYFRGKIAQENLIEAASIPYTIVHSTQFFEFLGGIVQSGAAGNVVRLSPAFMQPIASDDVAAAVADAALAAPLNATVEIAGPERVRLAE